MAKLIYFMPTSLDGFIAPAPGPYDWSVPDEQVMEFINELERPIGTYLYGRQLYETMAVWQTPDAIPGLGPADLEFARIWQGADKVVYSRTLDAVSTPNARLEREFDPQAVRELKARSPRDVTVGGPTLAAQAIRSGLVDEYQLLVAPMMLGGGLRVLPGDARVKLELLDERRFPNGMVWLRYRPQA